MNWYYLWPVPALCLLLAHATQHGALRRVLAGARAPAWCSATAGCTTSGCGGLLLMATAVVMLLGRGAAHRVGGRAWPPGCEPPAAPAAP